GLTSYALGQQTSYFYMPADLAQARLSPGERIRLGGLVEDGPVAGGPGTVARVAVTEKEESVKVSYAGILPALRRAGQGVVTDGTFVPDGVFIADTVLAKHDETYMPKQVADSLKEKGLWEAQ